MLKKEQTNSLPLLLVFSKQFRKKENPNRVKLKLFYWWHFFLFILERAGGRTVTRPSVISGHYSALLEPFGELSVNRSRFEITYFREDGFFCPYFLTAFVGVGSSNINKTLMNRKKELETLWKFGSIKQNSENGKKNSIKNFF